MASIYEQYKNELLAYDGKSITILSEFSARHSLHPKFMDHMIALSGEPEDYISGGATWIIKSHIDDGGALSTNQVGSIITRIKNIHQWSAQLHTCQIIGRLNLTKPQAAKTLPWLLPLLSHKRPFLRAWSLDAICALGKSHEQFAKEAKSALETAAKDPAASVRARARNLV